MWSGSRSASIAALSSPCCSIRSMRWTSGSLTSNSPAEKRAWLGCAFKKHAAIAALAERLLPGSSAVEHPTVNRMADGSNPSRGATRFNEASFSSSLSLFTREFAPPGSGPDPEHCLRSTGSREDLTGGPDGKHDRVQKGRQDALQQHHQLQLPRRQRLRLRQRQH